MIAGGGFRGAWDIPNKGPSLGRGTDTPNLPFVTILPTHHFYEISSPVAV